MLEVEVVFEFFHMWFQEFFFIPKLKKCFCFFFQGGSYLMYTYSVSGYDVNNKKFSPCSLRFIRKVLLAKSSRCFTEPEESFCGNLRVEGDEECDAGKLLFFGGNFKSKMLLFFEKNYFLYRSFGIWRYRRVLRWELQITSKCSLFRQKFAMLHWLQLHVSR